MTQVQLFSRNSREARSPAGSVPCDAGRNIAKVELILRGCILYGIASSKEQVFAIRKECYNIRLVSFIVSLPKYAKNIFICLTLSNVPIHNQTFNLKQHHTSSQSPPHSHYSALKHFPYFPSTLTLMQPKPLSSFLHSQPDSTFSAPTEFPLHPQVKTLPLTPSPSPPPSRK